MKDDGGFAFPINTGEFYSFGMSRRDYFAAAALAGGDHHELRTYTDYARDPEAIAARAYAIADAMLAESRK